MPFAAFHFPPVHDGSDDGRYGMLKVCRRVATGLPVLLNTVSVIGTLNVAPGVVVQVEVQPPDSQAQLLMAMAMLYSVRGEPDFNWTRSPILERL